jgi:hypothetical protein
MQTVNRGQKLLLRLVELKNRMLFGKDAVDAVTAPEDDIKINCPEIHNHYGEQAAPVAAPAAPVASPMAQTVAAAAPALSTLAKVAIAGAVGGPIGAGIAALPVISKWLNPPAAVAPADPGTPSVNIGGNLYELGVEDDTP